MAKKEIRSAQTPKPLHMVFHPDEHEAKRLLGTAVEDPSVEITCVWKLADGEIAQTATRNPALHHQHGLFRELLQTYDDMKKAHEVVFTRYVPDETTSS